MELWLQQLREYKGRENRQCAACGKERLPIDLCAADVIIRDQDRVIDTTVYLCHDPKCSIRVLAA